MTGKVSMVVACYNKEPYIEDTFTSILNQKWDAIELILVNDGSTDNTRQIIELWIPKFQARGYEVVVVDQENQGVAGAVRNGMMRITGDYFCNVDADDILDSEYVSTLAGFLEKNADYEWSMCEYKYIDYRTKKLHNRYVYRFHPDEEVSLTQYLTGCIVGTVWLYMARTSYLMSCGLPENFYTVHGHTQEPQIFIPLALGGGGLKYCSRLLYFNVDAPGSLSRPVKKDVIFPAVKGFYEILTHTFDGIQMPNNEKQKYIALSKWYSLRIPEFHHLFLPPEEQIEIKEEWSNLVARYLNEHIVPHQNLSSSLVQKVGLRVVEHAFQNCVLSIPNPYSTQLPIHTDCDRVIAFGALGKSARQLLPALMETPLAPTVFWDRDATGDEQLYAMPVAKPDMDSLSERDLVLILPNTLTGVPIHTLLGTARSGHLYYYEILDYLSAFYFPQMQNEAQFVY